MSERQEPRARPSTQRAVAHDGAERWRGGVVNERQRVNYPLRAVAHDGAEG